LQQPPPPPSPVAATAPAAAADYSNRRGAVVGADWCEKQIYQLPNCNLFTQHIVILYN
jgi:hypothetical protein